AIENVEGWPLVLLGNRDELHARATAGAQPWRDAPDCIGGKDLVAGGSWLLQRNDGRFAAVTNVRSGTPAKASRSRGELVRDFVMGDRTLAGFIENLLDEIHLYAAFNLVIGDRNTTWLIESNGSAVRQLTRGVHLISNGPVDVRWPKIERLRVAFESATARGLPDDQRLLDLLLDVHVADDASLPDTGIDHELEKLLSPVFICGSEYGTRASTLLLHDGDGGLHVRERAFAAQAQVLDEVAWACTDAESEWVLA
ncbi:MAG: NRDE family protein, partial [Dokdonella sp.]